MEFPLQHPEILKMVETHAYEKDRNWLIRAKGLLQSDLWSAETRLQDRPDDETLLAKRDRLQAAIDKIDGMV